MRKAYRNGRFVALRSARECSALNCGNYASNKQILKDLHIRAIISSPIGALHVAVRLAARKEGQPYRDVVQRNLASRHGTI